jgi:hypothetical protein
MDSITSGSGRGVFRYPDHKRYLRLVPAGFSDPSLEFVGWISCIHLRRNVNRAIASFRCRHWSIDHPLLCVDSSYGGWHVDSKTQHVGLGLADYL